jgi:hypothetical protein
VVHRLERWVANEHLEAAAVGNDESFRSLKEAVDEICFENAIAEGSQEVEVEYWRNN